jgi:oligopeptide transport system permease protein
MSFVTIFIVVSATFFLMNLMPGDPFIGNKAIPKAIKANLYAKYGLDKPLPQRYLIYLGNLTRGDLGMSMIYKSQEVINVIKQAFPVSADLGIRSLLFGVTFGILLGIIAALNHNGPMDTIATLLAIIGVSIPGFLIGTLVQYVFGFLFSNVIKDIFHTTYQLIPIARWEGFRYTLLPSFALGFASLALTARLMRTSMLDVLNQDYIQTAKSKGLTPAQVTVKHAIRNAILPIITILGPLTATIMTGTFVIERIFAIPGLGKFFVQSVQMYDYTMIMGLTIFFATFLIFMNLLVDIAYGFIDPRIRLAKGKA